MPPLDQMPARSLLFWQPPPRDSPRALFPRRPCSVRIALPDRQCRGLQWPGPGRGESVWLWPDQSAKPASLECDRDKAQPHDLRRRCAETVRPAASSLNLTRHPINRRPERPLQDLWGVRRRPEYLETAALPWADDTVAYRSSC